MILKQRILYQIRRKSDGLFSRGGTYPKFTKSGKVWNGKGPLNSHLTLLEGGECFDKGGVERWYSGCEIVAVGFVSAPGEEAPTLPEPVDVLEFFKADRVAVKK